MRLGRNEDEIRSGHLQIVRELLKDSKQRTYYDNHPELWTLPVEIVEEKMKTADLNEKVTFTKADYKEFFTYLRGDVPGLANLKNEEIYVWAKSCLDRLNIKDAPAMTTSIKKGAKKKYYITVARDVFRVMEESKKYK